ncbi:translation initiation factor [Haloarchaeobius litoreus]|uniref:Protein translation factor SUI1 homolog n=1 Tax=Haloarchaeobius litoreus TaxID=755306 RepID=A0ABD6DK85_9EURY|nr:translation initiation factor [Haloarchaeobius litoreus]
MSDNDPFEGLDVPDDPTSDLDRATQTLTVRTDERRYGKKMVVVEGFEGDSDLQSLASDLKSALGTGGTVKENHIELQGDHAGRVQELLRDRGYNVES